jgi:hypothetical protein
MAKKPIVNKTQAVRDYLKAHPEAMSGEIAAALNKQGIKITPGHVSNIKSKDNKACTAKKAAKKQAAAEAAAPAAVKKPTKAGDTITLDQVKKAAQTIKTMGRYQSKCPASRNVSRLTSTKPSTSPRRRVIGIVPTLWSAHRGK